MVRYSVIYPVARQFHSESIASRHKDRPPHQFHSETSQACRIRPRNDATVWKYQSNHPGTTPRYGNARATTRERRHRMEMRQLAKGAGYIAGRSNNTLTNDGWINLAHPNYANGRLNPWNREQWRSDRPRHVSLASTNHPP